MKSCLHYLFFFNFISVSNFLLSLVESVVTGDNSGYRIGVGLHDVTGPVGGVNMMGYAMLGQVSHGIHTRLFARAFIFEQKPGKRLVFVSGDLAMLSPNVKRRVIKWLREKMAERGESVDLYSQANVMISTIHTHSAPGGYHDYLLYSFTALGYVHETADIMVEGIGRAILRAHDNMVDGRQLYLTEGFLKEANINRSPSAYLKNPQYERDLYAAEGNTETRMLQLAIKNPDGYPLPFAGQINWFSVHGTSMNNSNTLVNGDNKGYASYLMERYENLKAIMNQNISHQYPFYHHPYTSAEYQAMAENGTLFVAAFAQSNEGDLSPNTEGAFCLNTGNPCDVARSVCLDDKGKPQNYLCQAHGPGWKYGGDRESMRIIGVRQWAKALQLLSEIADSESNRLSGPLFYEHAWIKIANMTVRLDNGSDIRTCLAARGYSFAAGTTDGPGAPYFFQGNNASGNPFWDRIRNFIKKPTPEQIQCHHPKPILLDTGNANKPYPWEASIVDIQLFQIGKLFILAVPCEFSTMAGRRLRKSIQQVLKDSGIWPENGGSITIAGLSNSYSAYVTTPEEYGAQRYEGASTLYGPNTLNAYIQEFKRLAIKLIAQHGRNYSISSQLPPMEHDPMEGPLDFDKKLLSFLPPVITDGVPLGKKFGSVVDNQDVQPCYAVGDRVEATFYTGHPRSMANTQKVNVREQLENSFMFVERYIGPSFSLTKPVVRQLVLNELGLLRNGYERKVLVAEDDNNFESIIYGGLSIRVAFEAWLSKMEYLKSRKLKVSVALSVSSQLAVITMTNPSSSISAPFKMYLNAVSKQMALIPSEISNNNDETQWKAVRDDGDWDTEYHWWKTNSRNPRSYAKAVWQISERPDLAVEPYMLGINLKTANTEDDDALDIEGMYRLRIRGSNINLFKKYSIHQGVSGTFQVVRDRSQCNKSTLPHIEFSINV